MPKAQMHFEVDHELKAHWKAFFALLPRKSETRVLTELMRNFLEKAKTDYKKEVAVSGSYVGIDRDREREFLFEKPIKEAQNDPRANAVDQPGNREGVHDESGVAVSGSNARVNPEEFCLPEDYGE